MVCAISEHFEVFTPSDVIYVFDSGEIKEMGTHDELVQKKDWYYRLVERQLTETDKK